VEGRKSRAFRQATFSITPGVKRKRVMRGEERNRMNCLKNNRMLPQGFIECGGSRRDPNVGSLEPAQDLSSRQHVDQVRFRGQLHPDARICAIVNKVIDEPGVPLK